MIREIQIENFKSIRKMKLELGRVNVFIGENGSGKSNVLEAIALAGAATANKLDNEFLASRGIRAVDARHMRCALPADDKFDEIRIEIDSSNSKRALLKLSHDGKPHS
ncbi:AAA family ATPase, partial [Stenotrophomonas sp. GbtcB23]|uniref:AAA family ATPase n=1 Tax=Stenotrophomonas sp. GbtcB23 TaxID=2824768 RepID=UPI001C2F74BB